MYILYSIVVVFSPLFFSIFRTILFRFLPYCDYACMCKRLSLYSEIVKWCHQMPYTSVRCTSILDSLYVQHDICKNHNMEQIIVFSNLFLISLPFCSFFSRCCRIICLCSHTNAVSMYTNTYTHCTYTIYYNFFPHLFFICIWSHRTRMKSQA